MHNRHFVISMTISGEKVPGFSAISLNLPPIQTDYTAHIIENSRRLHGVSKEFVDRYVGERYLVAEKPAQKPAAKPVQKPTPSTPVETPVAVTQPAQAARPASPTTEDIEPAKPKRKRTRKRKTKSDVATNKPAQSPELMGDSGEISLK